MIYLYAVGSSCGILTFVDLVIWEWMIVRRRHLKARQDLSRPLTGEEFTRRMIGR